MEKLKLSKAVIEKLRAVDDERFSVDLDDKNERYYLHRTLGALTNADIAKISLYRVSNKEVLQQLISAQRASYLVECGFLERASELQEFKLNIDFGVDGTVKKVTLADNNGMKLNDLIKDKTLIQKIVYQALSEYYKSK